MTHLLNLLDPNYTKEIQEKEYINKLKKAINICDNVDYGTDSVYKYTLDNVPVIVLFFEYTHHWKKLIPICGKYIIEIANKDIKPIFFFKFIDGLYIWNYDKTKIMFEYRYNENEKHSKFIYIMNHSLDKFENDLDL